ncbi:hypothetical protein [Nonomuraea roseoviolacea]|uniref:Lipoprotein n=1 Tax=Nonomuraea roseoviolacea subsp. carminata TaxID=160689 RepID=A0ABT1JR03_9ACTN|nr:hypothetical protein [Nonomuraea roseoviolacea]MCP2344173.1 hypothetical protein [Nonomuraea roseoviolacea subsp. carminata]
MRRIVVTTLLVPLLSILAACQNTPAATAGRYSTGGDPTDDPCARVVSAIGYADLLLRPRGQEEGQYFEDAVLGRLAEARGITLQYGPALPASLAPAVRDVEDATAGLSRADVPRARQVELLKKYRAAADRIRAGCA